MEELNLKQFENIGVIADLSNWTPSDEEDEDWERKQREKEDEEIRDFVKCHPMPSPDNEDGEKFWFKVIDRLKNTEGINGMVTFSFVRYDIMRKCMKTSLTKRSSLIDCCRELSRDGEFNVMTINLTLLSMAMDEMNDAEKPCLTQINMIEQWWDGIGKWKA